jgi:hypothetical protein
MSERSTENVVQLWRFTMPPEANYGRFFLRIAGKTVEIRFNREKNGAFTVAAWGPPSRPIVLADLLIDAATEEP